ncbi:transcriptional regulator [Nonomuraea sp. NPDC046570]|uniref:AfsR/SARP family transcriptional regulator n=1 Tax=Nonomuraea sp. NPDC046570 TaxID=3155255 RepID=UPI003406F6EE
METQLAGGVEHGLDPFIRLLGPVSGVRGARDLDLGSPRQRAVLAILARHAGHVVPMSALIDGVWGEMPPRSAEQSVYTYVAGLRGTLEPGRDRRGASRYLPGGAGGYRLSLDAAQVDALLFARRLDDARRLAREDDHEGALAALDSGLTLWRGGALSGVPGPFAAGERDRLNELRLGAVERRAEAMIGLGRCQDALPGLMELITGHPLRERPRELLILALGRLGRRADAQRAYAEAERVLAAELGVEPGEGLRRSRDSAMRDDPRPGPPPRSRAAAPPRRLPGELAGFVGRAAEKVRLRSLLAPWDDAPPQPLVVLSGPPGAGKTALAVHVAHLVAERFGDGQLYVDLHGATPGVAPLRPYDVLSGFLHALGVPLESVPADPDEAAARWRARLEGMRVLVVLDDAAGLPQIRPLLSVPAGNAVLVTSRETLAWADDCVQVDLGTLPESESVTMLARLAGAARTSADPAATSRLVRLCDGLPLALRIAGARLAGRPAWSVADLADRLDDEQRRLSELETGDLGVRAGLAASWESLRDSDHPTERAAARALGVLGLLRVPTVTGEVVGALLDTTTAAADRALDRLADAHLLDCARPGRYRMHDLVRLFAAEVAPADRRAPLIRALGLYAATARTAATLLDEHRVQPRGPGVDAAPLPLRDAAAAHAWLTREEPNLVAAAAQAMADPDDTIAGLGVALAFGLMWYQQGAYRALDLVSLNEQALLVGERLGDQRIMLLAHSHAGYGQYLRGRLDDALRHDHQHLALARRLGDRFEEQRAHGVMAIKHAKRDHYAEALRGGRAQLAIAREIGTGVGERYALFVIGMAQQGLGRLDEAMASLREGLDLALAVGDSTHEAIIRGMLGEVHLDLGCPRLALEQLRPGLDLARSRNARLVEARCLLNLTRAHRLLGDRAESLGYLGQMAALADELGSDYWHQRLEKERAQAL